MYRSHLCILASLHIAYTQSHHHRAPQFWIKTKKKIYNLKKEISRFKPFASLTFIACCVTPIYLLLASLLHPPVSSSHDFPSFLPPPHHLPPSLPSPLLSPRTLPSFLTISHHRLYSPCISSAKTMYPSTSTTRASRRLKARTASWCAWV